LARDDLDDQEQGLGALFGQLIDATAALIRAEIELQRRLMVRRLMGSQAALVMTIAAALLLQATVTVFLVGLVIVLSEWIGGVAALLIVILLAVGASVALLLAARKRFRQIAASLSDRFR
jgi:hypothetical protein